MDGRGNAQSARFCHLLNPLGQHNTRSGYGTVSNNDLTQGYTNSYPWLDFVIEFYELIVMIGLK